MSLPAMDRGRSALWALLLGWLLAAPAGAGPSLAPPAPAPVVIPAEAARTAALRHVDEARRVARGAAADRRFAPMRALYDSVTGVSPAALVRVGNRPAAYRVGLLAGESAAGELYLHPATGNVIDWPANIVFSARSTRIMGAGTYSLLDAFPENWASPLFFNSTPRAATMGPCMFDGIDLGKVRKVLGIPMEPADLTGKLLDHVTADSYVKQLKEEPDWVAEVNRRTTPPWKTTEGPRSVSAKCWSYAFSYAVDWWNQELGRPLGEYRSVLTGQREQGFDPRLLDLAYRTRAVTDPARFQFLPPLILEDAVTGELVLSSMDALASLLATPGRLPVVEPLVPWLSGRDRALDSRELPMDGQYLSLYPRYEGDFEAISRALHRHGVVIAGEAHRYNGTTLRYPTHAVPIVGTARVLGQPMLVFLDSLLARRSGPGTTGEIRLRMYPAAMFAEAYAFPHTLDIRTWSTPAGKGDLKVEIVLTNRAGRRLTGADRVEVTAGTGRSWQAVERGDRYEVVIGRGDVEAAGGRLSVRALRRYYYGASGEGATAPVVIDRVTHGGKPSPSPSPAPSGKPGPR